MTDPDGNTAAERMRDHGPELWEEKLHEEECLYIVKDMLLNDDQRAIEIFDELNDKIKANMIREIFKKFKQVTDLAIVSYSRYQWIQDYAWEKIQERREEAEAEHSTRYD